jgi:hypothetical protein
MNKDSNATNNVSDSLNMSILPQRGNTEKTPLKREHVPKYGRPHVIIPQEDLVWAMQQKPSINQFWQQCWLCDPYGSRWMPLSTSLTDKTLKVAKAALRNKCLFDFKTEMRMLEGKRFYETYVINLHGSRRKEFWSGGVIGDPTSEPEESGGDDDPKPGACADYAGVVSIPGGVNANPTSDTETQSGQAFQQASVTSQKHLSNSSKELLRCDQESPAVAPLGGATLVDSQEEELDKCECDTTNSDFPHRTQEIKLTNDELKTYLDAALKGVIPSDDVIGQLKDSDYWVCFRRAAEVHNWDLGQLSQSEIPAHLKEQMRSLREKANRGRF